MASTIQNVVGADNKHRALAQPLSRAYLPAMGIVRGLLLTSVLLVAPAAVHADGAPTSAYVARLRIQALLESLNAELLSHDSATATLQRWCDERGLAPGQTIVARRVTDQAAQPDAEVLAALQAAPGEQIGYRRVDLTCGPVVLSRAQNWYRPGRLTPQMNARLQTTQTPFGVVVRDLGYTRRTLSATTLYHPLAEGWRRGGPTGAQALGDVAAPDIVLRHRAVLIDGTGVPFSVVVENYTAATLMEPPRSEGRGQSRLR